MSKVKRKFLSIIDRMIGTTNVDDYDARNKRKVIEEVNMRMNRNYINRIQREINQTKRDEPSSYDWIYVESLEHIIHLLKRNELKQVRKSVKNLMKIHQHHLSMTRAYSYFLGM